MDEAFHSCTSACHQPLRGRSAGNLPLNGCVSSQGCSVAAEEWRAGGWGGGAVETTGRSLSAMVDRGMSLSHPGMSSVGVEGRGDGAEGRATEVRFLFSVFCCSLLYCFQVTKGIPLSPQKLTQAPFMLVVSGVSYLLVSGVPSTHFHFSTVLLSFRPIHILSISCIVKSCSSLLLIIMRSAPRCRQSSLLCCQAFLIVEM